MMVISLCCPSLEHICLVLIIDQGLDGYMDHVVELERAICESMLNLGPVIVIGDFNAYLGCFREV